MHSETFQTIIDLLSLPADDFVSRSYHLLLGRHPTPETERASASALRLGRGRVELLLAIHGSADAKDYREALRTQGSDADFIESTYRRLLGRSVDPHGLKHYSAQLERKTRSAVESDIAASKEAKISGTLWSEVEQLAAFHRAESRWWRLLHWQRRVQSLCQEVALHAFRNVSAQAALSDWAAPAGEALRTGRSGDQADTRSALARTIESINDTDLGADALHILNELKLVSKGTASAP